MDRLLSIHDVRLRIPVSTCEFRVRLRAGDIPKPVYRGSKPYWPESQITALIVSLGGKGKGFVRPNRTAELLGLKSGDAVHKRARRGHMPKAIKLFGSDRMSVWSIEDIENQLYATKEEGTV